jgi:hypothetical protein
MLAAEDTRRKAGALLWDPSGAPAFANRPMTVNRLPMIPGEEPFGPGVKRIERRYRRLTHDFPQGAHARRFLTAWRRPVAICRHRIGRQGRTRRARPVIAFDSNPDENGQRLLDLDSESLNGGWQRGSGRKPGEGRDRRPRAPGALTLWARSRFPAWFPNHLALPLSGDGTAVHIQIGRRRSRMRDFAADD